MRVVLAQQERERTEQAVSGGAGQPNALEPTNGGKAREHTELSVDLPQGQKLTVKGIEPGTIVEVASWSGKSGPHDGAIRMLFGASDQASEERSVDESNRAESEQVTGSIEAIPADALTQETGVEHTIDPRKADLQRDSRNGFSADQVQTPGWRILLKRSFVLLGVVGVLIGVLFGLRQAEILYFERPESGLTTGLGGAETSIAAVNPGADISINSTVLVKVDGMLTIVGVAQVGGNELLVFNGAEQSVVSQDAVVGRVLFVIPFLGYFFGAS